jgi:hypothetical protein
MDGLSIGESAARAFVSDSWALHHIKMETLKVYAVVLNA